MKNLRFWTVVLLLAATGLFLFTRPVVDRNPPYEPLSQLPYTLAGWTGTDQQIDQESLETLGAGDFVARTYAQNGQVEPIGLFIGSFLRRDLARPFILRSIACQGPVGYSSHPIPSI